MRHTPPFVDLLAMAGTGGKSGAKGGKEEREFYWKPLAYLFTFPALGGLLFGYDIVRIAFIDLA
jgi:hypothetical protein